MRRSDLFCPKRPTRGTYTRVLQKRPILNTRSSTYSSTCTYKRSRQKKPTKKAYKRGLQKRPTLDTRSSTNSSTRTSWISRTALQRDLYSSKEIYKRGFHQKLTRKTNSQWWVRKETYEFIKRGPMKGTYTRDLIKEIYPHSWACKETSIHQQKPTNETYKRDLQRDTNSPRRACKDTYFHQKRPTKEIYKRDLQKRPTRESNSHSPVCRVTFFHQKRPTKETYKKDLEKGPTEETNKKDSRKRPTKETYKRDLQKRPYFHNIHLQKGPTTRPTLHTWSLTYSSTHTDRISFVRRDTQKRPTKEAYSEYLVFNILEHTRRSDLTDVIPPLDRLCVAVCCSVLQCVCVREIDIIPPFDRQRVAVCCSVLQCVAVCCSVLQCVWKRKNKRDWRHTTSW